MRIMKQTFLISLMMLASLSQAQVTVNWSNFPGGVCIATDAVNNVYTAYWDYNPGGDITLNKRDPLGNTLWEVGYNNTDPNRHEVATWVETDQAGNILVSGTIRSGYSSPVNAASLLMKFNPSGTLLWRIVYESSFDGSSTKKCLVDANNDIYVLGIGTGPTGQVTKVKKISSSGIPVWNYFDTGIGGPVTFKFTPDSNIIIVHRTITGIINGYSKINLSGNNIWSLGGITSSTVGDASGDAFGNTYIVNGSPSQLKKLSPSGSLIWTQSNNNMNGNKVEVGTDNKPVVAGYPISNFGVVVKKYDTAGNLLWQNLDADGPALSLLALAPMRLDACNAAYIAGSTMSLMGICKVNSNGTSAWATTTSSGYPVWLEFGTDNTVFVTGGTTASIGNNVPCQSLRVKLFIQGYYAGAGNMSPVLFNQGVTANTGITDSIQVELRSNIMPYSVIAQTKTVLQTDGSATCYFPIVSGSYYVVIHHRNGLETWSANPVNFGPGIVNYDFSIAASQAFGSNQVQLSPGLWAIYSGDLNKDENIDLYDMVILDNDIVTFQYGYIATDLNGDGSADLLDNSIITPNVNNFIFAAKP
jgi:hypothetical protein